MSLGVKSAEFLKMSETLHSKETDILTQETDILENIREASEEAVKTIREEEKKLILEIKDRSKSTTTIIKNLKSQNDQTRENIESIKDYASSVISGTLSPDMIPSYHDLVTQMHLILENSLTVGTGEVNVTSVQFFRSKSKHKLGKLKHREEGDNSLKKEPSLDLDSSHE